MKDYAKRAIISVLLFLLFSILSTYKVTAGGGPHGNFTASTDECAACHRAHSATASELLIASQPGLCLSCHDGSGANTNVLAGIYMAGSEGTPGSGLRAGGFSGALMDVALNGSAAPGPVTSTHEIFGAYATIWGNGPVGSGAGTGYAMTCSDCHNPHGENSYRILRPIPIGSGATAPVVVPDQSAKNYTVFSPSNNYLGESYGGQGSSLTAWCSQCHTRYMAGSGSGHTDSGDNIFAFRHNTTSIPCITCHVTHGTTSTMSTFSGNLAWPDDSVTPSGNARSSLLRANNRAVCVTCHVTDGQVNGGNCDGCHGAPPNSGAHLAHSSSNTVGYGMIGAYNSSTAYAFGCGECHPTDSAFHQDGTVQVDLSPASAPAGSLKQNNAAGAAYNGSTCGSVYCHSGEQVSSGAVGAPLADGGGNYILDAHGNFTYNPYTVTISRSYAATPAWDGGSVSGSCSECHAFPLTTSAPGVQAGVGNSHQWVDDFGYGNLHAYNMGFSWPVDCKTCHYGEITTANSGTRNGMDVTTYNPVPLADKTVHVNGQAEVAFNTVDPVVYKSTFSLSGASYNPSDQSCANVACHLGQTYAVWGAPYRWWTNECNICHRFGMPPAPAPAKNPSPGFVPSAMTGTQHPVAIPVTSACSDCHVSPHR